jgi:hypothetical protein
MRRAAAEELERVVRDGEVSVTLRRQALDRLAKLGKKATALLEEIAEDPKVRKDLRDRAARMLGRD